jgi:phosphonate ABC transporter permease subunit PhnE
MAWFAARWALPQDESVVPSFPTRLSRGLALFGATLAAIVGLAFGAEVLIESGRAMEAWLPSLPFLGKFVGDLGDILQILLSAVTGLAAAGYLAGLGARLSRILGARLPRAALRGVEIVVSIAAGAALLTMIGAGVVWLYELRNPVTILSTVAGVGAVIGLALSVRYGGRDTIPIGLAVYYLARTIFNGLRAIEALIMAVVFVVWVGIGPFAGVLALSLHSIAAMAKLYSEQVESILPGPLEAITATGATRIQTIIYAVIPQIIPPYISFTMYRWDINVRMSTIIGFAGGGGIGFLLFQNINLLNYRAASVQMLAIAIVVASMDYLSSALRERVV